MAGAALLKTLNLYGVEVTHKRHQLLGWDFSIGAEQIFLRYGAGVELNNLSIC